MLYLYADSPEDRNDLRQDILSRAWAAYPRFQAKSKFSTWLYRIALNAALTRLRKQKQLQYVPEAYAPDPAGPPPGHEAELLGLMLSLLTEIEKSVLLLMVEGYDRPEIAEMIGISENNLRVKIFRLRQKLKTHGIERYVG